MHRLSEHSLWFVLSLLISLALFPTQAVSADDDDWLAIASKTIQQQEKKLKKARPDNTHVNDLANRLKQISHIKSQAQDCIIDTDAQLLKNAQDLEILGEASARENPEVAKKRRSLNRQQRNLDKQQATCKLLQLQSQDLVVSINQLQQSILAQQLSARTSNILDVFDENIKEPVAGWQDAIKFFTTQYELKLLSVKEFALLIILAIMSVVIGVVLGRMQREDISEMAPPADIIAAFILSVRSSLGRALPILMLVGITAAFLSIALPLTPLPFITKASYVVGSYISLIVVVNILLSPAPPATIYLTGPEELSRRFARHLKLLLTLGLIGFFLFTGDIRNNLSDPVYYFNRSIFSILLVINLISTIWLLRNFSWAILSRKPRILLTLVLLATLITELAGYRNLSAFVLGGLMGTSVGLAVTLLVYHLFKDLCDGLDEGRLEWEIKIRDVLNLHPGEKIPGLIWVRLVIFVVLWGGFAILALSIWRLDDPWLTIISSTVTEGFNIGSMKVTPTLLIGGVLALVLLLSATRYVKNHILPHGLKHTQLDRGAREAVSSLFGYAGVAIAFLVALSIAGVKMQNVALIAGALSVGIGFGLQNIVNNFISGLILLFERPIRRGDWVVTGDTEGYVKSINIRSTQIQTFDKADVIVPNSELITAKVTNWMLRDNHGRIVIRIGVGYGSDVEKVHGILMDIAQKHPMVMDKQTNVGSPRVLFTNFGDSALEFEMRCFIYDIDQRLNVISEMNFQILAAFRKEGIEIPFPQRVVTMNTPPEPAAD